MNWTLKTIRSTTITLSPNSHKMHNGIAFQALKLWWRWNIHCQQLKAPWCVSFFVWTVTWNKILMGDNLGLRSFDFVDWYIMCHICGVTVDLLLHCEKAHRLWSFVFKPFGILWVLLKTVLDLLFGWWNWLEKHSFDIWNLVLLCLLWSM